MRVTVKYELVIASIVGLEFEIVELPEGTAIAGLIEILCARHSSRFRNIVFMQAGSRKYMVNFIVNTAYVKDSYTLKDGDELTIVLGLGGG
jgi:molybdopterin converting factor small subunit